MKTKIVKQNKHLYLWIVQRNYQYGHGWEDLCASESYLEARSLLRDHRVNQPEFPYRLIQRREKNV